MKHLHRGSSIASYLTWDLGAQEITFIDLNAPHVTNASQAE